MSCRKADPIPQRQSEGFSDGRDAGGLNRDQFITRHDLGRNSQDDGYRNPKTLITIAYLIAGKLDFNIAPRRAGLPT